MFVFAAMCAGAYYAGGSTCGLFAALTAYRFLLCIGIGQVTGFWKCLIVTNTDDSPVASTQQAV